MNTPVSEPIPAKSTSASKRVQLAAEGVPPGGHVQQSQVLAVEQDQAGAGAEHGLAGADELAQRVGQALALHPERHRGGLATRDHEGVEPLELLTGAHRARLGPQLAERPGVCLEVALEGEHPDDWVTHQPRF